MASFANSCSPASFSPKTGTLRGLHFERAPYMEEKLVSCHGGAIFDVAVDVRPDSPTFARWVGYQLSGQNHRMLYIPKGFAHGFITLLPDTAVGYQIAEFYVPGRSTGIRWDDPEIGVEWPIEPTLVGERDQTLPLLRDLDPKMLGGIGV
jgi:dTDP-4-dehydrorhamnose 3,5-epimerase